MLIHLEKQKLTFGQLSSRNIIENISDDEKKVIKVITAWQEETLYFDLTTSGSTGNPATIQLQRERLLYSAKSSLQFLDPNSSFGNTLLCINPAFVGGLMVIVRALIADLDISVISPASKFESLPPDQNYDLTSMVPIQLQYLLDHAPEKLNQFNTILIGGAPLPQAYVQKLSNHTKLRVFQTYGMTETASHIALKNLSKNQKTYNTLGDVLLETDERQCLRLKGTITDNEWIQTNDIVRLISSNEFEWLGRADFVINSGGIKIHPEILEEQLSSQIKFPFFVAGIEDSRLGERAVLLIETKSDYVPTIDFSKIDRYKRPKEIHCLSNFKYTESGKINRIKTLELITNP